MSCSPTKQAAQWFDVADVVKAPARLDWAKLNFVNQQYLRNADDARLVALVREAHRGRGVDPGPDAAARLAAAVPLVKEGAHTTLELADLTAYTLLHRPLTLDDKALKRLDADTRARLGRLHDRLNAQADWIPPALDATLRDFAATEGVGLGKFGPALRATLAGATSAPDLASTLVSLGREESLGRLSDALSQER